MTSTFPACAVSPTLVRFLQKTVRNRRIRLAARCVKLGRMLVLLVRHTRAGERSEWERDDRLRPLDKKGRRQAEGLVELLEDYPIERILSSPYTRCTQTMEPLAEAHGLPLEEADELAEGKEREDVLRLLSSLDAECVVLCTHGDVAFEVLGEEMRKGETEALDFNGGVFRPLRRLARPR
jgi:phosphohistidine phosphatase SixA